MTEALTRSEPRAPASGLSAPAASRTPRPSSLIDTRVIYCGDCLDQLRKLPDACIDLIYIDPPACPGRATACVDVSIGQIPGRVSRVNSNRNYEVYWGETKEKRAFEDRHASTAAYIDYMRPRCVELARVLKKTGSFYHHCDWHCRRRMIDVSSKPITILT